MKQLVIGKRLKGKVLEAPWCIYGWYGYKEKALRDWKEIMGCFWRQKLMGHFRALTASIYYPTVGSWPAGALLGLYKNKVPYFWGKKVLLYFWKMALCGSTMIKRNITILFQLNCATFHLQLKDIYGFLYKKCFVLISHIHTVQDGTVVPYCT